MIFVLEYLAIKGKGFSYMAIGVKDKETLQCLLDLERSIFKEYKALKNGQFSREKLLSLLGLETDLLENFDITSEMLHETEQNISSETGINFKTLLPYGLTPFMTDATYPYVRLFARLQYMYRTKSSIVIENTITGFQDLEIGLLYRSLIHDIEIDGGYSQEMKDCAWKVLIDSPFVEREVVKNDMHPLEYSDDSISMHVDLMNFLASKSVKEKSSIPAERSESFVRKLRFSLVYPELINAIKNYVCLYSNDHDNNINVMACLSYLKVLVATQKKMDRVALYNDFINDTQFGLADSAEFVGFVKSFIEDTENLAKCMRTVTLTNNSNIIK